MSETSRADLRHVAAAPPEHAVRSDKRRRRAERPNDLARRARIVAEAVERRGRTKRPTSTRAAEPTTASPEARVVPEHWETLMTGFFQLLGHLVRNSQVQAPTRPAAVALRNPVAEWLASHQGEVRRYAGLRVAIHRERGLVASAEGLTELIEKVKAAGIPVEEVVVSRLTRTPDDA